MAPQFTATNGASARDEPLWIRRAATSLPEPDSPAMYTGACERASFAIISRTRCIGLDSPMKRGRSATGTSPWTRAVDCAGRGSLSALVTSGRSCSILMGLAR